MNRFLLVSTALVGFTAAAFAAPAPAGPQALPALSTAGEVVATPQGVTLRVIRIGYGINPAGSNSNQPRDRNVFANEKNQVLYSSDGDTMPNQSACSGECPKTWIPAVPVENAKPVGYWTIITRDDGSKQWAFRGKPMYTYAPEAKEKKEPQGYQERAEAAAKALESEKEKKETQTANVGNNAQVPVKTPSAIKTGKEDPKDAAANLGRQGGEGQGHDVDGHHVLEILPAEWISAPSGIVVTEVRTAPGYIVTDAKGLPLYAYEGKPDPKADPKVGDDWAPFVAPQVSLPVGDFTILSRADGILQWAYKGKALYRFKGDLDYGDTNGKEISPQLKLVFALRYFMPEGVSVQKNRQYGGLLALADGTPLYARENLSGGSDGALRGDRGKPQVGEKIGVGGCDSECEKQWKPLLAADDAKPSGYWTLYSRGDGKKQWAYFGYALYAPATASMKSTEVYDPVTHFEPLPDGGARTTIPLHWRVAPP